MKAGVGYRPVGSLCVKCWYRPARIHARWQRAALYCSDKCATEASNLRRHARTAELTNELRSALGLPATGADRLSVVELTAMIRRVRRLAPAGMSPMPAGRAARKRHPPRQKSRATPSQADASGLS